jgi:dipeptidyl aminopeptidase/acylaminoacyl peptidase
MTSQRDLDEPIHAFLLEGPAELSSRLLASIRDDVHGTHQRARWRPWRTLPMPRPVLIFAVLGALIVVLGAAVLVGTGGRPTPVAPTTTSSPAPSTGPSAQPSLQPSPGVSPYPIADGEPWIVLAAETGGATLVKPDGTGSHEILRDLPRLWGVHVVVPNWSPDGRQIVFEGNGDRGSQVWAANADGTGSRALMPTPDGCPNQTCTEGVQPAWSPDGRSIAYIAVTHAAGTFSKISLAILDVATGASTVVFETSDATLARPSWSPDGRRIAVEIDRYEGLPEQTPVVSSVVGVITVAGSDHNPREITSASLLAGFPTWHPTDDLIVIRTNRYDDDAQKLLDAAAPSNLFTIRSDGSGMTAVTNHPVGGPIVRAPTWTSDGRIMFGKLVSTGAAELLRVIGADGTGEASATGAVATIGEGRWRPIP